MARSRRPTRRSGLAVAAAALPALSLACAKPTPPPPAAPGPPEVRPVLVDEAMDGLGFVVRRAEIAPVHEVGGFDLVFELPEGVDLQVRAREGGGIQPVGLAASMTRSHGSMTVYSADYPGEYRFHEDSYFRSPGERVPVTITMVAPTPRLAELTPFCASLDYVVASYVAGNDHAFLRDPFPRRQWSFFTESLYHDGFGLILAQAVLSDPGRVPRVAGQVSADLKACAGPAWTWREEPWSTVAPMTERRRVVLEHLGDVGAFRVTLTHERVPGLGDTDTNGLLRLEFRPVTASSP